MTGLRRAIVTGLTVATVCSGGVTSGVEQLLGVARASSIGPAPAVEQGDRVYFGQWTNKPAVCTVGYTDHARGISYVAAHCGGSESTLVSIADRTDAEDMHPNVGVFYPSATYTGDSVHGDWGYIRWNSQVHLGLNTITGDSWASSSEIRSGEKVCHFGTSSHLDKDIASCGTFVDTLETQDGSGTGGSFRYVSDAAQVGDSGGPVWVERDDERLFIGVHSATATTVSNNGATSLRLIGTTPDPYFQHPADPGNVDGETNGVGSTTRIVRDPLGMVSSGSSASPMVGAMTVTEFVFTVVGIAVIVGLAGPVQEILRARFL